MSDRTLKVDFFGSDVRVLEKIDDTVHINKVFVETHNASKELLTYGLLHDVEICQVTNISELPELNTAGDRDLGISCGCGLIFKNSHIDRYPEGIMNIHPGWLPENRGRHPLSWSVVKNEWLFGMSFHMITEEIDQGLLVHSFAAKRSIFDDATDIEAKFIARLDSEFPVAIKNMLSKNGTMLQEGTYLPPVGTTLKKLVPSEHSAEYLLCAIRSQASFGGIDFGIGQNIKEGFVRCNADEPGYEIITSSDNVELLVK